MRTATSDQTLPLSPSLPGFERPLILLLAGFLLAAGLPPAAHAQLDEDAFPRGGDGWTVFELHPDARVLYVSSSEGNDATATFYTKDRLGGSPFQPPQDIKPYKTVEAAFKSDHLRDGASDWILLKRGDTWEDGLPKRPQFSGRSGRYPFLVSAYGKASDKRPLLKTGVGIGMKVCCTDSLANVAITDLHFYADGRDPDAPTFANTPTAGNKGLRWVKPTRNLLIEGNKFSFYTTGIVLIGDGGSDNVHVRRNVITDSYSTDSHAQGLYATRVDGLLIEENVFDHNGWNAQVDGAEKTIFNHNMYIQSSNEEVIIRENLAFRASSHGTQLRSGGRLVGNLYARNPLPLYISGGGERFATGQALDNVVLQGRNIGDQGRGQAMEFFGLSSGRVAGNLVIDSDQSNGSHRTIRLKGGTPGKLHNLTIENNVSYNWKGPLVQVLDGVEYENIVVRDNRYQVPDADKASSFLRFRDKYDGSIDMEAFTFTGNTYFGAGLPEEEQVRIDWLDPRTMSLATWKEQYDQGSGSAIKQVSFPDPERDLARYHGSLGRAASFEAFVQEARKQRRGHWRSAYTAAAINGYIRAGFGMGASDPPDDGGGGDATEPEVKLERFSVSVGEGGEAMKLAWTTASEKRLRGFSIKRSTAEDGPFREVAFIAVDGSATVDAEAKTYRYVDRQVSGSFDELSYRLDLVGTDGKTYVLREPEAETSPAEVEGFALSGAYPNPFSERATIAYRVARASEVRLEIFDALGRKVTTLAQGEQARGRQEVVFEAGSLPSGVYLVRLMIGEALADTRKIVLVR